MNLWIRTQDKQSLIPINDILKVSEGSLIQTSTRPYMVEKHYNIMYRNIPLGEYKSDKRALEVLDEIDKYKNKLEKAHFLGMEESEFVSSTFQMPKE